MIFIENLLEIYYRYKAIVLNPVVIVVLIGTLYELYFLNRKRENIEEPILRNILLSFIAICIGWIFYATGLMPEITYPYFNEDFLFCWNFPCHLPCLLNYMFIRKLYAVYTDVQIYRICRDI